MSKPSFTRIHAMLPDIVKVEHQDGTITTFGSGAAYAIFCAGLRGTAYDLYDATSGQWVVGTVEQLDSDRCPLCGAEHTE